MFPAGTRLDASAPIAVLEPLRAVNQRLLELLDGFGEADWGRPTAFPDRSVKDLTAHLLQGSLSRVSALRDGYQVHAGPFASRDELTRHVQGRNREFIAAARWLSPRVLRDLLSEYDRELVAQFERLDPHAPGLGVVWAGEWVSANWFDMAREYSEKWHHQQQLRDATLRPLLDAPELATPALETFARALPFAYRALAAPAGTTVSIALEAPAPLAWSLCREVAGWALYAGKTAGAAAEIDLAADLAWRLWTRSIPGERARGGLQIVGDPRYAEPLLHCVAVLL